MGAVCTVVSILLSGDIMSYVDGASIFIVVGGTIAAIIASYPLKDIKNLMAYVKIAMAKSEVDLNQQIEDIVDMANIARKNGLLALEDKVSEMNDPFLINGIMLILDGTDPELVKSVLETEIYYMDARHSHVASIFDTGSSVAPAFGMIGTLIGLINMLKQLDDTANLGPSMAVALITTFYGVVLANLIFSPIANQLRVKSSEEQLQKDIIIEGVLSIQDGENPRVIRDKLTAFISNTDAEVAKEAGGAAKAKGVEEGGNE